jgi:hypothetical protein
MALLFRRAEIPSRPETRALLRQSHPGIIQAKAVSTSRQERRDGTRWLEGEEHFGALNASSTLPAGNRRQFVGCANKAARMPLAVRVTAEGEVAMPRRGLFVWALAAVLALASFPAAAGSPALAVSPLVVPPIPDDALYPIRMPLAGAFIVSQPPHCAGHQSPDCRTIYYFQGRWAGRPDIFYIIRPHD